MWQQIKCPEDGIYENVDVNEYRKWDAFSYSMCKEILKSPKHLDYMMLEGIEMSESMIIGSVVDTLVTGSPVKYVVMPEFKIDSKGKQAYFDFRSNEAKELRTAAEKAGKFCVKKGDYDLCVVISNNIKHNKTAKELMDGCQFQIAVVWTDKITGFKCKGLIDLFKASEYSIVDIKTTTSALPEDWRAKVGDLGYHIQAAAYLEGIEYNTGFKGNFYHIVAETEKPYGVANYALREDSLTTGQYWWDEGKWLYKEILENPEKLENVYPDKIQDIDIRPYLFKGVI